MEDETIDEILGGRLRIVQKKKGYRFSLDAFLLAHFIRLKKDDHIIDLGTGSGVIAIIMGTRKECGRVVGIDVQEEMVDMAKRSVAVNTLSGKVEIRQGDVKQIEQLFPSLSFDVAIFNPPYRKLKSGRINPDNQKSIARHEIKGTLNDFLHASVYVLKKNGRVYIIYPATRMVELLSSMKATGIEPKRMQIVHSYTVSRGEFVLVEGIKGGREELEVVPPMFVYTDGGNYTDAMSSVFRELSDLAKGAAE
ncbi:MAG: methyltransferase domain-containing protein [Syntrophaceae bacterium]